jgi:acyl CoA:acetate/3-ketoacid CoA transferase beta subunit
MVYYTGGGHANNYTTDEYLVSLTVYLPPAKCNQVQCIFNAEDIILIYEFPRMH